MQIPSQTSPSWIVRTGSHIDRIRINALRIEEIEGRAMWVKRRTRGGRWLVPLANAFFWLARNPVRVLPAGRRWQEREAALFRLLNGSARRAIPVGEDAVAFEPLRGMNLVETLTMGRFSPEVAHDAGRAFLTMHQALDPFTQQPFSHGDPHLGNVIYCAADRKIGWIDFETEHLPRLTIEERRVDDLLIFLLDLAGRVDWEQWTLLSPAFLNGYAGVAVIGQLGKRLTLPGGFGAIWWAVRTSYLPRKELRRRLAWLQARL